MANPTTTVSAASRVSPNRKPIKISLSKEQKVRVAQLIRLENRLTVCREYIHLWSEFFKFFADDIQQRQISDQEEKAFFQMITNLARKHFLFCELMSDTFDASDKIMEVLVSSVALSNIKAMNEANLQKLELDWHSTLISMYVATGRLLRLLPPGTRMDDALAQADAAARASLEGRPAPVPDGTKSKKGLFGKSK